MKTYPIYAIAVDWIQNGEHRPEYPNWHKGLKIGRIRNNTNFSRMYQVNKSMTELLLETKQWWKKYKKEKLQDKNPSRPKISIKFVENEVWCPIWFSHWTFDVGQTDQEALDSFQEFIDRKERLNVKNGHMRNDRMPDNEKPFYCSMGANDRWRWSGQDDKENTVAPPCRCKHCKKFGVIRIGH